MFAIKITAIFLLPENAAVYVKNLTQLLANTTTPDDRILRQRMLQAFENMLVKISPAALLSSHLHLSDNCLVVDGRSFELGRFKNIYVIGAGKASGTMAIELEKLLGDRLAGGCVNIPHAAACKTSLIEVNRAGHPHPDAAGVAGARTILKIADKAGCDDLVVCLFSGGGSSLLPLPRAPVTLADKRLTTDLLLKSEASIDEVNTVRKHISAVKGGWLAQRLFPATVLNLVLSDVIGDPLDFIASGPVVPDSTSFDDAFAVLQKYHLWSSLPVSVQKLLEDGMQGLIEDTPVVEDPVFTGVFTHVIGNNRLAREEIAKLLAENGFATRIIADPWQGDANELGRQMLRQAEDPAALTAPLAIVAGGEAKVKLLGSGKGGRNQQAALATVRALAGKKGTLLAFLATDGIDGPTDACGALVDDTTLKRVSSLGLMPESFLENSDSYGFFERLDDLVKTGYTGSNVNDIYILLIDRRA